MKLVSFVFPFLLLAVLPSVTHAQTGAPAPEPEPAPAPSAQPEPKRADTPAPEPSVARREEARSVSLQQLLADIASGLDAWLAKARSAGRREQATSAEIEMALEEQSSVAAALAAVQEAQRALREGSERELSSELENAANKLKPLQRQVLLRSTDPGEARAAPDRYEGAAGGAQLQADRRAIEDSLRTLGTTKAESGTSPTPSPGGARVTLENGSHFKYGLSVTLLRFSTSRRDDEPARLRNYSPKLEAIPAELGFQFTYSPSTGPWRLESSSDDGYQFMSVGGIVLAQVDNQELDRGSLSLGGTLSFFEDSIGLGVGFDLYRGIPVAGPDGAAGGATAFTGVLAWALARDGEVTPENVFVVLTVNVAGLAGKLGEADE